MEETNYTILIAEDDIDIANLIKLYLESDGFHVLIANDGQQAIDLFNKHHIDLALLDIMMPKMNGLEVVQQIRKTNNIPLIIVSARNEDTDKINGLSLGADDYITKPFNPLEVVARVKSNLRRFYDLNPFHQEKQTIFKLKDLELDLNGITVKKNGKQLILTPTEFKILALLIQEPGKVFTKRQLCEYIMGDYIDSDENTLLVHISNLRDKIEDDKSKPTYLITVRGLGYKLQRMD